MKQIIIGDVLNQAWELTKKHWAVILACIIGVGVIQYIFSAILGPNSMDIMKLQQEMQHTQDPQLMLAYVGDLYSQAIPSSMVSNLIRFILMVGVYQTLLNCARGKGDFSIDAWKKPISLYAKMFITDLAVGFIVGLGVLCCILPGIYLYARLQFCSYYFLDHPEAGIGDAISASWNMTSASALNLSLLLIVYALMAVLGVLCCCVGAILAEIIIYLAITVCYLTLAPEQPKAEVEVAE